MYRISYRFLVPGWSTKPLVSAHDRIMGTHRLAVRLGRSKNLDLIVLRHQIAVLHRQNHRPAVADEDRALLSAIAARHGQRPERASRYAQAHRSPVLYPL